MRTQYTMHETIHRIARWLAVEPADVVQWYAHDAIAGLDGLTARQLVACGRGGEVVDFLLGVLAREGRDACDGERVRPDWGDPAQPARAAARAGVASPPNQSSAPRHNGSAAGRK